MKYKVAVITANFGGMDSMRPIPQQTIPFDFACYSEANSPFPLANLDARMKAKYFKLQAHKLFNQDILIWIDGNIEIKSPKFIEYLCEQINSSDIVIRKHPDRDCIYDEYDFILSKMATGSKYLKARYSKSELEKEREGFKQIGFPSKAGLYWCGLFARRNNAWTNDLFDRWWNHSILWNNYDQNSFAVLTKEFEAESCGIINVQDWSPYFENEWIKIHHHNKIQ